jgi:ribosomal protein L7/L12
MEKLNKELESKVKELVKQGNVLEAVKLVQQVLKCGLRNSKEIVDSYRK